MKSLLVIFILGLYVLFPSPAEAQNLTPTETPSNANDSTLVVEKKSYKTAEITYEIENTNREIKDSQKKIESHENLARIDTSFTALSNLLDQEFENFQSYDIKNLSKFFLINTKRVWSTYKSQLDDWNGELSNRINDLMDISEKIKRKESLWNETSGKSEANLLPDELHSRIKEILEKLGEQENDLFLAVKKIAELDSRILDKMIEVDEQVELINELQNHYKVRLLKATEAPIWRLQLSGSFEGSLKDRLQKAWYENTKSLKDSYPIFKGYLSEFISWIIFIIVALIGLRYLYFKQNPSKRFSAENDINELTIRHTGISALYLFLFVFFLLFKNLPLALSGFVNLVMLVTTYFLLQPYLRKYGKRLILIFIPLLVANMGEIVFWYLGSYAQLYLLFEASLGILLLLYFFSFGYNANVRSGFRYRSIVNLLRYPVFVLYAISFLVNLFGYQNLGVFLLKVATQLSYSIIIIIGAWEVAKSILFVLFNILTRFENHNSYEYLPILEKRLNLIVTLFFALIGFHIFLVTLEIDTTFYDNLRQFLNTERQIGNFVFTYLSIYQFVLIILITWALVTIIKVIFNEGNFKRTQRLRGVPAAISITLRLAIALGGFLFAMSVAGMDLTKISIMLGAFSVGIGFGLQNIVNNFISGLILIYERPIQVGDTIEINTLMGEVKKIGIRSSKVRTYDGAEVVVPNSILVSDQLINWTLSDNKRRIEIIVGVKYGSDPKQIIDLLKQVASENELVAQFPEPVVLFNEFADSSLNFRLLCWVLFENGVKVKSDLSIAIDQVFKEHDIEIPFPQLDLHVKDTPELETEENLKETD